MADEEEFEPRLGRMRSTGGKRPRKYLGRVLAAANLAGGGAMPFGGRSKAFSGSRIGRGAGSVASLPVTVLTPPIDRAVSSSRRAV
ncbi:hypothetical protein [Sphingomonas psychrotolerans]|uniref:hypothetical protein n=1 Tax=Sphingomonas psychrotolerans TaxID=1327635 RepID=UPI0018F74791|nr:hypothetical protein [Sphingomonas psychrotolerans]